MEHRLHNNHWTGSDDFFRSVYENANDAIFLMDGDIFIDCNRKTEEMFRCSSEDILNHKPHEFSPPSQPDGSASEIKAKKYIDAARSGSPQFFEWKHRRADGSLFDAEVSLTRVDTAERTVLLSMVRDISRRKMAEDELKQAYEDLEDRVTQRTAELQQTNTLLQEEVEKHRETQQMLGDSETRYRRFLENFNGIVLEMDSDGGITFMNKYGRNFFGFSNREIIGKNVIGTIVSSVGVLSEDLRKLIQNILKNPEEYFTNENENIRKNGEKVWIAWTNRVIYNPEKNRTEILCIGVDRTEQKRAQERLAEEIMEKASAAERNRLARELHDAVSQTLFSASLIAEVLPRLWQRDEKEGMKRLDEVRQLSKSALAEMRTLLFELRPATLAEAEPGELLRQLAESVYGRYQLPVELNVKGIAELPPDVKITFYRVAQEALNNITKHAGATQVTISFTGTQSGASMLIEDNGKGFDPSVLLPENMGLRIMQERAEAIAAEILIDSQELKGTCVQLMWNNRNQEVS